MSVDVRRGHRSPGEARDSGVDITDQLIESYFLFHRDRYLSAMRAMAAEEEKALSILAWELRDEVSELVSSASVILLPTQSATPDNIYVKFLLAREFQGAATFIELLRDKEGVLKKEFGLTVGQLMLLSRKRIQAERRVKEAVGIDLSGSLPVKVSYGEASSAKTEYEYDRGDIAVVMRMVLAEADKRGLLRRGKDIIILSSTDLALFGLYAAKAGTGLQNTRIAIDLPVTADEAREVYNVLVTPGTASMFMWNVDMARVVDAVAAALLMHEKLPRGLKALIDKLVETELLLPGVKRIAQAVGPNPVLVYVTSREWLALMYGYMNRRADKLFEDIVNLGRTGHVKLAEMILREFERLVYRTANIAVRNVVGSWKDVTNGVAALRAPYIAQLKPLVSGLDTETLERMEAALRDRAGPEDVMQALFSIGAFNMGPRSLYLTVVGRALQVMIREELRRRGTSTQRS